MDKKVFYDVVRKEIGRLKQSQVAGFERYLDEGSRRRTPLDHLGYIIATVMWETARTMQPVKEAFWKSEAWRKANLRYFPWYGRGDIQLTWEANYKKAGEAIGVDLIKDPDAAMDPENAVKIAFEGMTQGWFTGKELDDYLDGVDESAAEDLREFRNARRIINGVDRSVDIAKLALIFEGALRAAGYDVPAASAIEVEPATDTPATKEITMTASAGSAPGQVVAEKAVTPTDPVTDKPLTPLEQMNKPVQGAKANVAGGGIGAIVLTLWVASGYFPEGWKDPAMMAALGGLFTWLPGVVGNFVGAYLARDKRFGVKP